MSVVPWPPVPGQDREIGIRSPICRPSWLANGLCAAVSDELTSFAEATAQASVLYRRCASAEGKNLRMNYRDHLLFGVAGFAALILPAAAQESAFDPAKLDLARLIECRAQVPDYNELGS